MSTDGTWNIICNRNEQQAIRNELFALLNTEEYDDSILQQFNDRPKLRPIDSDSYGSDASTIISASAESFASVDTSDFTFDLEGKEVETIDTSEPTSSTRISVLTEQTYADVSRMKPKPSPDSEIVKNLQKQIEKLQNQIQQVILEKDEAIQDKIQQEKETEKAKTLTQSIEKKLEEFQKTSEARMIELITQQINSAIKLQNPEQKRQLDNESPEPYHKRLDDKSTPERQTETNPILTQEITNSESQMTNDSDDQNIEDDICQDFREGMSSCNSVSPN